MNKTILASTAVGLILLVGSSEATAQAAEVNPHGLEYGNIDMARPDFDEPFQRDGRIVDPASILRVLPGASADDVRSLLGEPIGTGQGTRGPEWDYNIKLDLADEDFIVCQYKVVFDARGETVVETSWRRYQCRDALGARKD